MAKITMEELSGSLKEYLNGLGLTEAQVQELIDKFEDEKIGDISQLSTENKTNIVTAINELFQSANNGKELIANAIGEPLSKEDTFSAMSTDINGLLSTFKINMMNNGVTVNSGDKFKALIDKIATLADNEGNKVQFVTGFINTTNYLVNEYTTWRWIKNSFTFDSSLDFTPTRIILSFPMLGLSQSVNDEYYLDNYTVDSQMCYDENNYFHAYESNCNSSIELYITNISNTGFDLYANKYTEYYPLVCPEGINWLAIGVGEEDTTLRDSLASILEEEGVDVTEEDDMASLIGKVDEEFDRQVVPQGTATINDVVSGKTFINSTGQLLTGTASKGLATATGTVNVSSTLYTSKSFTINIDFTPTRLILIVPKVWYNSGVIEHKNVIVTNETTTLNAGPNENGTIKVSSMTSYSFNIQMSGLQIPECTITWIAIG